MAEQDKDLEKHIFSRLKQWEDGVNERDFDKVKNIYTENGAALPNQREAATGREEIKKVFSSIFPEVYHRIDFEKHTYFEKICDDTVFANSDASMYDENGKKIGRSKDSCLWKKKENGEWYLQRCMFNESPFPESK